jgi:hypothetical protein
MAPKLGGAHRLLRVLRTLYCDHNPQECARVKWGHADCDVPPDMMPNGISTSELEEEGL